MERDRIVCLALLALKGTGLPVDDDDFIAAWLALADGTLGEAALADCLRARMRQVG